MKPFVHLFPAALLLMSGCASLPPGQGRPQVQALVEARGLPAAAAADDTLDAYVRQQLEAPLTLPAAVQLALINNPQVVQGYAQLGIAAAEVYDAGRLSNPHFSTAVMTPDAAGGANQVTFGIVQRFSDLLLLPMRRRLAEGEFERAQADTAQALLNHAADTEAAWFTLLGAETLASQRAEQAKTSGLAAELSRRLFDAGNVSARTLAEARATASSEQLAASAFAAELAQARVTLETLLGLPARGTLRIAGEFAPPPPAPLEAAALQEEALAQRPDLASRRQLVSLLVGALADAHRLRYLGEVSVGVETERETDRSRITGPSLAIELPLFNQGEGKLARAAARLELARSSARALALEIQGIKRWVSLNTAAG